MSTDVVRVFLKRWWFIGAALFGLGGWVKGLQGEIEKMAPLSEIVEMKHDIKAIKAEVEDMSERQRAFFCQSQGEWCR